MRSVGNNSTLLSLFALLAVGGIAIGLFLLRDPGETRSHSVPPTPRETPDHIHQDDAPVKEPDEIVIADEAKLVETPIPDLTKHAAAVGTPDGTHVAFDILTCRLAIAWRGRFIDTDGNLLSDDRIEFASGPPFAPLLDANVSWPRTNDEISGDVVYRRHTQSYTGRPTFEYELVEAGVRIYETVSPVAVHELDAGGNGIQRRLVVKRSGGLGHVWFRAAVGDEVVETDDAFVIDDRVTIRFSRRMRGFGNPPVIRERSDGKFELLMPFFDPAEDREQHELLDVDVLW